MQKRENSALRIGTRDSILAQIQAQKVAGFITEEGLKTTLFPVKTEGDLDLKTPLYKMGIQGVFTKTLDTALLNNKIDLAVHSLKDVPTSLPQGLKIFAVLPRDTAADVLLYKHTTDFLNDPTYPATIATGSIRRKAQWLHKYPLHNIIPLRGNIQTRIQKLNTENWDGIILSLSGLLRLQTDYPRQHILDFMLPAPAQGVIVAIGRENDRDLYTLCQSFHDTDTAITTQAERDFLKTLGGICSTPVSATANLYKDRIFFEGNICSYDGIFSHTVRLSEKLPASHIGKRAAEKLLENNPSIVQLLQD